MKLNERIKDCRQRNGMTQEQVAEALQVSRQAVTKWENGQSAPSTENLFRLAELFGTTVDFLVTEERTTASVKQNVPFWKNNRFFITIIVCFWLFICITPFEVDMYTPELFQCLCIMLNLWTVAWFGVLLYLLLIKSPMGESRGIFTAVLLLTGVCHCILGLFFWQCWVCVCITVIFLLCLFLEKYRKNRKKSEKST